LNRVKKKVRKKNWSRGGGTAMGIGLTTALKLSGRLHENKREKRLYAKYACIGVALTKQGVIIRKKGCRRCRAARSIKGQREGSGSPEVLHCGKGTRGTSVGVRAKGKTLEYARLTKPLSPRRFKGDGRCVAA